MNTKPKRKSRFSNEPNHSDSEQISQSSIEKADLGNNERNSLGYSNKKIKSNETKPISFHKAKLETKQVNSNEDNFIMQMKEAAEKAKKIADKLNSKTPDINQSFKSISTVSMTAEQQKQYSEQKELQEMYEAMMSKRNEIEKNAKKMKFKREYDSDEEIDEDGTWEHKLRKAECEATKEWAIKLTSMGEDKHHIGDFLPPKEFEKFMETFKALKEGRSLEQSDYKDFKIKTENIGFKLLSKLGWKEGQGLGKDNQGITAPINKGTISNANAGLGTADSTELKTNDSDFDMYRKRMQLAYKFRPNPMNNPRRSYY